MSFDFLDVSGPDSGVSRVELTRKKKKNALCMALRDELETALHQLAADPQVKAVVLTGGDGIFSAGYDLREGAETGGKAFLHRFTEFFTACYCFPKPVIAAVDGPALAGGFDLALMADLIVASTRARFGHPEIAFAPVAVTPLSRFLHGSALRRMCLLGELIDADEAKALGIVHEIVEPAETLAAATRLANRIAGFPPGGVALTKRALDGDVARSIARDLDGVNAILAGADGVYDSYVSRKLD